MQDITDALLATQRALLGVITPRLRAVEVNLDNDIDMFFIHFYYDGEASEDEIDLWQCAVTEASAGLDSHYALDNRIERLDFPKTIPRRGQCAYFRKE